MDITPKKWPVSKVVAIALMVIAFIMLNTNWLKLDNELLESVDELKDEYEEEMEWIEEEYGDDIEEFLDEEGYVFRRGTRHYPRESGGDRDAHPVL